MDDLMDKIGKKLPEKGIDRDEILKMLHKLAESDVDYKTGRTWSLVYHAGEAHTEFLKQAHGVFFETNGLNPMAFTSLKRFEHDVVSMTAHMLHGGPEAVGTITSGGTESIFLAIKTYRDMARRKRPWIRRPNIVAPVSAHVAFKKACEFLDVRMITAPLDKDFRVDMRAVRRLVNHNTILLVGSAPNYPYGTIDPIEELGRLAQRRHLPLHVDGCLGGFMLPFVERAGYPLPLFDFRVPGVTSMSADVHKYGYAAKGASVVVYRSMDYLQHQFFIETDWPGGLFASAGVLGTRPGGSIAAAWAAMLAFGEQGYTELARKTMETTRQMQDGIRSIPGLAIVGRPDMTVFAYHSTDKALNIYAVGDLMEEKGWHIDRLPKPPALHAMVTINHQDAAQRYVEDLRASVEYLRAHPDMAQKGSAPMYGLMAKMPLRGMVKKNVLQIMKQMYSPEGRMPDLSADGDTARDPLVNIGLKALQWWERFRGS